MKTWVAAVVAVVAATMAHTMAQHDNKKLFHVTAPQAVLDSAMHEFPGLDVWDFQLEPTVVVHADVFTTDAVMQRLTQVSLTHESTSVLVEEDDVQVQKQIDEERATAAVCHERTKAHLTRVSTLGRYVDSEFFDCWRPFDHVFAFLDKLAAENPTLLTKLDRVATTVQGRDIPAYRISTGNSAAKKTIYTQGVIHAREWHAGSTTFFAMASLLDGLRGNDAVIASIFESYDWLFVPIVNIDGYKFTWEGDRLWRRNRRELPPRPGKNESLVGVDLNRNFGPPEFWNLTGYANFPDWETYPGPQVLSEPEAAGIFAWLQRVPGLVGAVDVHSYSGLVLRPFGNQKDEAPEPFGSKLRRLGDNVRDAIQRGSNVTYTTQTTQQLYYAYGTFQDSMFMDLNKIASLTFELEGDSFIQPVSSIRPVGQRILQGLCQFALELTAYYSS